MLKIVGNAAKSCMPPDMPKDLRVESYHDGITRRWWLVASWDQPPISASQLLCQESDLLKGPEEILARCHEAVKLLAEKIRKAREPKDD